MYFCTGLSYNYLLFHFSITLNFPLQPADYEYLVQNLNPLEAELYNSLPNECRNKPPCCENNIKDFQEVKCSVHPKQCSVAVIHNGREILYGAHLTEPKPKWLQPVIQTVDCELKTLPTSPYDDNSAKQFDFVKKCVDSTLKNVAIGGKVDQTILANLVRK